MKIETKVDDNYEGAQNRLAVHIHVDEGPRTEVGAVHIVGNEKVKTSELPELTTETGQPYSEQELANDRERILSYYFDHGFPNASRYHHLATTSTQSRRRHLYDSGRRAVRGGSRLWSGAPSTRAISWCSANWKCIPGIR